MGFGVGFGKSEDTFLISWMLHFNFQENIFNYQIISNINFTNLSWNPYCLFILIFPSSPSLFRPSSFFFFLSSSLTFSLSHFPTLSHPLSFSSICLSHFFLNHPNYSSCSICDFSCNQYWFDLRIDLSQDHNFTAKGLLTVRRSKT